MARQMRLCITFYVYCWTCFRLSGCILAYISDSNAVLYKRCLGRTCVYQYKWRHIPYYGPRNLKVYALLIVGFLSCLSATDADSLWILTGFDIRAALVGFILDKVTKYYLNMNILLHSVFIIPPKLYFVIIQIPQTSYCKLIAAILKLPFFVCVLLSVIPLFLAPFNRRVIPVL